MNEDGSDRHRNFLYFYPDKDNNPDFSHPMNKAEIVELYWAIIEDDPSSLAELYIDFHPFSRIEFIIFRDRLSSAILVSRAAKKEVATLESRLRDEQKAGSYVKVPGWELEASLFRDEALNVAGQTYSIVIGSAIVAAVAALEALLIDLMPEVVVDERPSGTMSWLSKFLNQQRVPHRRRKEIEDAVRVAAKRRDKFAHRLTGSYFSYSESRRDEFTPEWLEDTFYIVGRAAVDIEELLVA